MENLIGKTILGYKLVEKLGSGAYGTVFKAEKENPTGKYIRAVKFITIPTEEQYGEVLSLMGGDKEKADQYFENLFSEIFSEVKILNEFTEKSIPNVVRYYDHDIKIEENPKKYNLFILMEYLTPFHDYLSKNEITVSEAIKMTLDILKGLSASHGNGVIHRDIKLDNIFVTNAGDFKLGDFGVSKILDKETKAQTLRGTPDYIAPEVYLGKESYDKTVDLYSLGITLYRLLNYNRNPFLPDFPETYTPENEDEAFNKRMSGEVPDLPILGGQEIGNVILKAIAPKDQRFETADDFYFSLINAVNQTSKEELEMVINEEGTPFHKDSSNISEQTENLVPIETVKLNSENSNDNIKTFSQRNYDSDNQQETVKLGEVDTNVSSSNYFTNTNQPVRIDWDMDDSEVTTRTASQEDSEGNNQKIIYIQSPPHEEKKGLFLNALGWIGLALFLLTFLFLAVNDNFRNKLYTTFTNTEEVPYPVYSLPDGEYDGPIYITIENPSPGTNIYYTVDGTTPNEDSHLYTPGKEIEIDDWTTLRSVAIDENGNKSKEVVAKYEVTSSNLENSNNYSNGSYKSAETNNSSDRSTENSTYKGGPVSDDTYIMGNAGVTSDQLANMYLSKSKIEFPQYYRDRGVSLNDFCQIYIEEAEAENVRADIAFGQAMLETGFLGFGGSVGIEQLNFAGLGATDSSHAGADFAAQYGDNINGIRMGIRAQIQHLKAYASTEPLNNDNVDPRYKYVTRGESPTLGDLTGTWAEDPDYSPSLERVINYIYE